MLLSLLLLTYKLNNIKSYTLHMFLMYFFTFLFRVQESHLIDLLNKEWLKDIGITAIGDVTSILQVSRKMKKQVSIFVSGIQNPFK